MICGPAAPVVWLIGSEVSLVGHHIVMDGYGKIYRCSTVALVERGV